MASKSKSTFRAPSPRHNPDLYVGIDNGMDGGITVLNRDGKILARTAAFTEKVKGGRQLNLDECYAWLYQNVQQRGGTARFYVEKPNNAQTKTTAASMKGCFETWRTMIHLSRMGVFVPITPQWWHIGDHSLLHLPVGKKRPADLDTKVEALAFARKTWPDENWLASARCSVPHDGIVDAACIAYFGLKHGL